jgi:hypothetical protein
VKNGAHYISGVITISEALAQTNILITVGVYVSYDSGTTFSNISNSTHSRLGSFGLSIPYGFTVHLFSGARIRITVNTSGTVVDLLSLASGCSLNILSFDHSTTPTDLFPIYGSFYKCVESNETFTLPNGTPLEVTKLWTKYIPAGTYKATFTGSIATTQANTTNELIFSFASPNNPNVIAFDRTINYVTAGEYSLNWSDIFILEQSVTYVFINMVSNKNNTATCGPSLLELVRVA